MGIGCAPGRAASFSAGLPTLILKLALIEAHDFWPRLLGGVAQHAAGRFAWHRARGSGLARRSNLSSCRRNGAGIRFVARLGNASQLAMAGRAGGPGPIKQPPAPTVSGATIFSVREL